MNAQKEQADGHLQNSNTTLSTVDLMNESFDDSIQRKSPRSSIDHKSTSNHNHSPMNSLTKKLKKSKNRGEGKVSPRRSSSLLPSSRRSSLAESRSQSVHRLSSRRDHVKTDKGNGLLVEERFPKPFLGGVVARRYKGYKARAKQANESNKRRDTIKLSLLHSCIDSNDDDDDEERTIDSIIVTKQKPPQSQKLGSSDLSSRDTSKFPKHSHSSLRRISNKKKNETQVSQQVHHQPISSFDETFESCRDEITQLKEQLTSLFPNAIKSQEETNACLFEILVGPKSEFGKNLLSKHCNVIEDEQDYCKFLYTYFLSSNHWQPSTELIHHTIQDMLMDAIRYNQIMANLMSNTMEGSNTNTKHRQEWEQFETHLNHSMRALFMCITDCDPNVMASIVDLDDSNNNTHFCEWLQSINSTGLLEYKIKSCLAKEKKKKKRAKPSKERTRSASPQRRPLVLNKQKIMPPAENAGTSSTASKKPERSRSLPSFPTGRRSRRGPTRRERSKDIG